MSTLSGRVALAAPSCGIGKAIASRIPVGTTGSVDEVGRIAVMLTQNSFITGQTINPNGAMYLS